MSDIVVGIDLGTTNSCAAVYYDENLKILENTKGKRTTPSVVYYDTKKESFFVGDFAKKRSLIKPGLGVSAIKRLIGREKNDPRVKDILKYFPFKLDPDSEKPNIVIQHKDYVDIKSPSSISALILMELKNDVNAKLGKDINKAVITVPAYFNVSQREATLEAAKKAGFEVLKLLNEPTAAALSYYHYKKSNKIPYAKEHYSMVFDLGGGTFDVAVIKKSGENIEVLCVDGDSYLGGDDFDQEVFDFVCKEISRQYNFNIIDDRRITRRLISLCEEAKKEISTSNIVDTQITLELPAENNQDQTESDEIHITLTKEQFEKIIEPYIQNTIQVVDNCLKTSKLSKDDIAEIILVGGSTRIPKIQETLSKYFNNRELSKFVNPDECVAEGAAIQAALLSKSSNQHIESIQISEVTPFSLGISKLCYMMTFIIPRNSKLPITKSITFVNCYDQQTEISFNVYEGERLNARKNRYLATLTIDNLTPAPPKKCKIDLKMSIDNNGILTVTAQEQYKNNTKDLKITYTRVANYEDNSKHEIQSSKEYEEEDRKFEEFANRQIYLFEYCVNFCYQMKQKHLIIMYKDLYEVCENAQKEVINLDLEEDERLKELTHNIVNSCDEIVAPKSNHITSMPTVPVPDVQVFSEEPVEPHYQSPRVEPHHQSPQVEPHHQSPQVKPRLQSPQVESHHQSPQVEPHHQSPQMEPHQQSQQVEPHQQSPQVKPHHQSPQVEPHLQSPQVKPRLQSPQVESHHQSPQVEPHHQSPQMEPHQQSQQVEPHQQSPQVKPHHQSPQVEPHLQSRRPLPHPRAGYDALSEELMQKLQKRREHADKHIVAD